MSCGGRKQTAENVGNTRQRNTTVLLQGKLVSMYDVSGSLMPSLEPCRVVAGSKLRRMSEIPGRGNTTVLLQGKLVSMYDVSGSLMPSLEPCRVVAGSKLLRMSEIPGRGTLQYCYRANW